MSNPNNYTSLDDSKFDVQISLRQAYMVMHQFLRTVYNIEDFPTKGLLSEISLVEGNTSFDPAILSDFFEAYQEVINDPSPIDKVYQKTDKAKTEAMGRKILDALGKVLGVEEDDQDKDETLKQA